MPKDYDSIYLNGNYNLDQILTICYDFYGYSEIKKFIYRVLYDGKYGE